VLAAQSRGLLAPRQGRPHALDLVGGDLLAVAGAADHDAEGVGVRGGALGGAQAEGRVVVRGAGDVGPAGDGLMPGALEPLDEVVLEFVAGMVGTEVHAHGQSVARDGPGRRAGWCRRKLAEKSRTSGKPQVTIQNRRFRESLTSDSLEPLVQRCDEAPTPPAP